VFEQGGLVIDSVVLYSMLCSENGEAARFNERYLANCTVDQL
jgi:hypothetical protein